MDKFGIFNLLNSFFPLANQKNESTSNNNNFSSELLSGLLSSFKKDSSLNIANQTKKEKSLNNAPHPLQEQMLSTINSHDQIVKRVKQSQKTY